MSEHDKAKLWDEVVRLVREEHMSSMLLGQTIRHLVRENSK